MYMYRQHVAKALVAGF